MRYEEYFELSERIGWRITDLDWDALRAELAAGDVSDFDRQAVLATAVIEHGVPHYSEVWSRVNGLRDEWELWQFTTLWTGEEHRHSYALKKAADVLGIVAEIDDDLAAVKTFPFAERQKQSCASDCYTTVPGMLTYATIQELATAKFYTLAAKRAQSRVLRKIFTLIGNDEMRHHVFYRNALADGWQRSTARTWYSDQVFDAAVAFHMPHRIYGLQMSFFEDGDWSISGDVVSGLARCFAFDPGLLARFAAVMAAEAGRSATAAIRT